MAITRSDPDFACHILSNAKSSPFLTTIHKESCLEGNARTLGNWSQFVPPGVYFWRGSIIGGKD